MDSIDSTNVKEFNKWAKTYDLPLNHFHFDLANKKLLKVLSPIKGKMILDVGCGTGILLNQFARLDKNFKLYGLDVSREMLSVAKNKLKGKNVKLMQGSASKIPFKTNTFDYVTCVQSFHHHPNSLYSLRQMRRVIKTGGKVAILDSFLDGFLRRSLHNIERWLFPVREGNIRRYTKKEMRKLFQQVGLKNITQRTHHYFALITVGEK